MGLYLAKVPSIWLNIVKNETRFKGPWGPSFFKPVPAVFWQTEQYTGTYFHIPEPDGFSGGFRTGTRQTEPNLGLFSPIPTTTLSYNYQPTTSNKNGKLNGETWRKSHPGSIPVHGPDRPITPTTCCKREQGENFCQHEAGSPHLSKSEIFF